MLRKSFDGIEDRRIVVLRLVDPCRDRPHPHQLRRIRLEQISRIGLVTQPAIILVGLKDSRHPVVDLADQFIGRYGDDGEGSLPLASRVLPVLSDAGDPEWRAVAHRNREGELRLGPLKCLPLEKAINRQDAAAPRVCFAEHR